MIGAARHERSADRLNYRNGYRDRTFEARLGPLSLRIPKLRQGSYFPPFLEPRRIAERTLVAVIQEASVGGVSTRRVDDLMHAMGFSGLSKSPISKLCKDTDARVNAFDRPDRGQMAVSVARYNLPESARWLMPALKRILTSVLSCFAFFGSTSPGVLAITLDKAKASEFFRWFHLEEVESETLEKAGCVRVFRPQSDKFRPLVMLEVTLAERDRIAQMRLVLLRSFIADPRNSAFARDIAKSFMLFAARDAAPLALTHIADEIQFRNIGDAILMRSEPLRLPVEPSPAYRVFAGGLSEAQIALAGARMTLRNEGGPAGGALAILVSPIA